MAEILPTLVFYLFAGVTLISALMVITSKNPVHSVFFLILAFFNSAGLFVLLGAEYIAMTLVIVYVGAVAVLFLFVVMMLDINFEELRKGFLRYLPAGLLVAGVLLAELVIVMYRAIVVHGPWGAQPAAEDGVSQLTNVQAIGSVLYTQYVYAFQIAGLILLVAMIGAIVLTLRHRPGVRRQNISKQLARKRKDAVEVVKVPPGQGVQ